MGYIVIDTCVWIELASKPSLRPLLDALEEFVKPPPHRLVVPAPVATEFARNRAGCRNSWERSFKGHIQGLKFIYTAIPETKDDLVRARDLAHQTIEKSRQTVQDSVGVVDKILNDAKSWDPAPEDYQDTCSVSDQRSPGDRRGCAFQAPVGSLLTMRITRSTA